MHCGSFCWKKMTLADQDKGVWIRCEETYQSFFGYT